jgi:hypothetical protein
VILASNLQRCAANLDVIEEMLPDLAKTVWMGREFGYFGGNKDSIEVDMGAPPAQVRAYLKRFLRRRGA